jgi:hypothetical protein
MNCTAVYSAWRPLLRGMAIAFVAGASCAPAPAQKLPPEVQVGASSMVDYEFD